MRSELGKISLDSVFSEREALNRVRPAVAGVLLACRRAYAGCCVCAVGLEACSGLALIGARLSLPSLAVPLCLLQNIVASIQSAAMNWGLEVLRCAEGLCGWCNVRTRGRCCAGGSPYLLWCGNKLAQRMTG